MPDEVKQNASNGAKRPRGGKGRKRVPGRTRLSAKNQITIPVDVVRKTGLEPGDELAVEVGPRGRIVVSRSASGSASDSPVVAAIAEAAGSLTGIYPPNYLEELRAGDIERDIELGIITREEYERALREFDADG